MRPLLVFLAALAVETGHVLAGSRVWQPSASTPQLDRRYFIINTDPGPTESKMIWPNRQLRLCFANDQARAALKDLIIAAHDAWLRRGLGSEFTVVEAGDNECADKRFDTLMVEWSGTNGRMATYVGLPGEGNILRQSNDPDKRPKMVLTTSTSMGMLNQEANVAHELGHAWGLYHEHQNPAFWSRGAISNGQGGTVFGPENGGNWRCENLLDYQDRVAGGGLVVQKPGQYQSDIIGVDMLCKDLSFAQRGRFSAADYLPQPRDSGIATPTGQIDWLSIMLYPSGAGARGDASPDNDQRLPILMKPDGSRIDINKIPSLGDLEGMHALYGGKRLRGRVLLQKAGGSVSSGFKNLFSKSSGNTGSSCL